MFLDQEKLNQVLLSIAEFAAEHLQRSKANHAVHIHVARQCHEILERRKH